MLTNQFALSSIEGIFMIFLNVILFQSTNGVYVNNRQIQPEKGHQLKHCDRFSLGPVLTGYEWRFEERVKNENTTESQM